ncbi:MAG: hypothetical protein NPIRA04_12130 [Nitrospirales bacterium]|nr:MAG: hypothetical protein NPIRA04_12130 [Nitrospirales bacterium]
MKSVTITMIIALTSFLVGCASSPNVTNAIRVTAFGNEGRGPMHEAMESLKRHEQLERGVVYEFNPGDIVQLWIEVNGAFVESAQMEPVDIIVQKKMWFLSDDTGFYGSVDGEQFSTLSDLVRGSLQIKLDVKEDEKSNNLSLRVIANPK